MLCTAKLETIRIPAAGNGNFPLRHPARNSRARATARRKARMHPYGRRNTDKEMGHMKQPALRIRREEKADEQAVETLIRRAF